MSNTTLQLHPYEPLSGAEGNKVLDTTAPTCISMNFLDALLSTGFFYVVCKTGDALAPLLKSLISHRDLSKVVFSLHVLDN